MPIGNQTERVVDITVIPPPPAPPPPESAGAVGEAVPVALILAGGAMTAYGFAFQGARVISAVGLGLLLGGLIQLVVQRLSLGRPARARPRMAFASLSSWTLRLGPYESSDLPEEFNTTEASAELVWNIHPTTGPGTGATIEIHHPMAGKVSKTTCLLEESHDKGVGVSGFVVNDYLV
ncbi:MAG TPA: hypothetical protein VF017_07840 [Thermoanaerobaculia bacterium]|nr:hypothetical protein [Thermoanaerobaculia bacterium]